MSKNYKDYRYFENRPDVVKVWNDLDTYLDFCRFELRPFDPAHLYRKDNDNYRAFLDSQRPKRQWQNSRPRGQTNYRSRTQ